MNDALRSSLQHQLGPRYCALPDGRVWLAPTSEAELRLVITQFHRFGEPLHAQAELCRAAMAGVGPIQARSGVVEADAGASLGAIDRAAEALGLCVGPLSPRAYALDLASFLEGPYAGLRPVLGGRLESLSLSLEAILPDGIAIRSRASPRSAAGPDLDALLLGGEGRFGWVSRASLRLLPRPEVRRRVVYSFPDGATLAHAARRLLEAGCNVQCGWAQRRGGRSLLELELGGNPESIERDLSTCSNAAAEAGGRASGQVLDDAPSGDERELSWDDVAREVSAGGRVALFRLATDAVIATGASRGRLLATRQPWHSADTWERVASALAQPTQGAR